MVRLVPEKKNKYNRSEISSSIHETHTQQAEELREAVSGLKDEPGAVRHDALKILFIFS